MKIRSRDSAQQDFFSWCVGGGEGFARKQMMNKLAFWFVLSGVSLVCVLGFIPCKYGSRMKVRSGSWWCEVILDLSFVDDTFLIRDELVIGLYGLWRNEPEWFVVARFWIIQSQ